METGTHEGMNEGARAVERMKAYICDHLGEPITARDIARAAGYSPYHAARVFKAGTGLSPFEYVRRRRLLQAAFALRDGKPRVIDVALEFVFDSQEGFTRAFSNAFGISPHKYAACVPEGWLVPYRYLSRRKSRTEEPIMSDKQAPKAAVIFTQIVERPARKLLLKRSKKATEYFEYCEEFGCGENNNSTPWDVLCAIKDALYEPVGLWLPEAMRPEGTGVYAHGVEVAADYQGKIPEGFDVIDLEPCKLIVFQGEPYDDENFGEAVGAAIERIGGFNPEVYGWQYAPEAAPRMQLAPMGWRGYIEMRPVREVGKQ